MSWVHCSEEAFACSKKNITVLEKSLNFSQVLVGSLCFTHASSLCYVILWICLHTCLTVEKAFDHVDWTKLMMILQNIGVDWKDKKLIWNLYNKQVIYIRTEDGLSTACAIGRGKAKIFTIPIVIFSL